MAAYHPEDIQRYFKDVFGYDGEISESADRMRKLFEEIGVDMYFDGDVSKESVSRIEIGSSLTPDEVYGILEECTGA